MKKRKFGRKIKLISLICVVVLSVSAICTVNAAYTDSRTGDANGDGEINIKDLLVLDANINGKANNAASGADVNGDGLINSNDLKGMMSLIKNETKPTYYLKAGTYSGTQIATYGNYDVGKNTASKAGMLGYALYSDTGRLAYSQNSEFVTRFLAEAKAIADYCKANNFSYGSSSKNPAMDCSEKIISCDRFVGWVLYNCGFTDQPADGGMYVYGNSSNRDHHLGLFLEKYGWKKITNSNDIQAGDIVFVNPTTANGEVYGAHVFICAGKYKDNLYYRYDMGSVYRARCTAQYSAYNSTNPYISGVSVSGQPFAEAITNYAYSYRYVG